jgi:predicted short-subunit dehydrogenase-like oxidoreductase (DUF2520 family)
MQRSGVTDVREDLVALADSAIRNWRAHAGPERFTGPAARGDQATIDRHVAALAGDPQLAPVYELLADYIARCYDRSPVLEP